MTVTDDRKQKAGKEGERLGIWESMSHEKKSQGCLWQSVESM